MRSIREINKSLEAFIDQLYENHVRIHSAVGKTLIAGGALAMLYGAMAEQRVDALVAGGFTASIVGFCQEFYVSSTLFRYYRNARRNLSRDGIDYETL